MRASSNSMACDAILAQSRSSCASRSAILRRDEARDLRAPRGAPSAKRDPHAALQSAGTHSGPLIGTWCCSKSMAPVAPSEMKGRGRTPHGPPQTQPPATLFRRASRQAGCWAPFPLKE